jgi:hypothetical protein
MFGIAGSLLGQSIELGMGLERSAGLGQAEFEYTDKLG